MLILEEEEEEKNKNKEYLKLKFMLLNYLCDVPTLCRIILVTVCVKILSVLLCLKENNTSKKLDGIIQEVKIMMEKRQNRTE